MILNMKLLIFLRLLQWRNKLRGSQIEDEPSYTVGWFSNRQSLTELSRNPGDRKAIGIFDLGSESVVKISRISRWVTVVDSPLLNKLMCKWEEFSPEFVHFSLSGSHVRYRSFYQKCYQDTLKCEIKYKRWESSRSHLPSNRVRADALLM